MRWRAEEGTANFRCRGKGRAFLATRGGATSDFQALVQYKVARTNHIDIEEWWKTSGDSARKKMFGTLLNGSRSTARRNAPANLGLEPIQTGLAAGVISERVLSCPNPTV